MKKKLSVGIIGIGEVGNAVLELLQDKFKVFRKDVEFDEIEGNEIDYLHVCIPYIKDFEKTVGDLIKKYNPQLTVIHSTVGVGATKKIYQYTKKPIVHSPTRGDHKNFVNDLKTFIKYIGPIDKESTILAKKHLREIGFKVEIMNNPEETELGKLLDTTYYGWNILFTKLVGKLCEEKNLSFENVYTKFNQSYNKGYKKTKPNVLRPVLTYKHERDNKGGIGGHCVIENTVLLDQLYELPLTKFIIREDAKLKSSGKK
jgi:UDP-N-acetyl-D-mannosaminuronate dehydrogenase